MPAALASSPPIPVPGPPLRVLVADDEPTALRRLARLLGELPGVSVVAQCTSGRDTLRLVHDRRPDVVFLDIQMPGLDGLTLAHRFAATGGPVIVFVTAFDEHALAAFRVHAADYVLKPVDRERLREAVEHARLAVRGRRAVEHAEGAPSGNGPRFTIRDGHQAHLVPVADIAWVESFGNYARVYTTQRRYIHRGTMAALTEQLAPHGFARIHRCVIVNVARVTSLRPAGNGQYVAVLDTGARLRVSRTYRERLEALRPPRPTG